MSRIHEHEYPFFEKQPSIDPSAFIATQTILIGDVRIHEQASVWYGSVIRGDINYIEIGKRSNIQDGSILHVDDENPCVIGNDVTVGHGAIIHGCVIEDGCMIGMGAVILSGAYIKKGSLIAAGAVVREKMVVDAGSLMAGVPAKKMREDNTFYDTFVHHAQRYVALAQNYKRVKRD